MKRVKELGFKIPPSYTSCRAGTSNLSLSERPENRVIESAVSGLVGRLKENGYMKK